MQFAAFGDFPGQFFCFLVATVLGTNNWDIVRPTVCKFFTS